MFNGISGSGNQFAERAEAAYLEFPQNNVPLEEVTTIVNLRKSKGEEKEAAMNAARKAKKRRDLLAAV